MKHVEAYHKLIIKPGIFAYVESGLKSTLNSFRLEMFRALLLGGYSSVITTMLGPTDIKNPHFEFLIMLHATSQIWLISSETCTGASIRFVIAVVLIINL